MAVQSMFSGNRSMLAASGFTCAVVLALAINFLWADGHDRQRCVELAILLPALAIALARGSVAHALQAVPTAVRRCALGFLSLGALSTVFAYSPRHAMNEWSMFVLLGIAGAVVAHECARLSRADGRRLMLALAWVCGAYALRQLLVYAAHLAVASPLGFVDITVGFSQYRFLNHAQTALMPLLILLAVPVPDASRARRIACFALASFWWSVLFFVQARASLLGLLAGAVAVAWVRRRHALPFLKTMALTALCGLGLYVVLFIAVPVLAGMPPFSLPGSVIARSAADPASGRQFMWKLAIEQIARHPLLGIGPQHFAHVGADIGWAAHPHDWVLQIAVEWGIPALLCFTGILALGVRGLLRAGKAFPADDGNSQACCAAALTVLVGVVVDSLFSGVLVMPQSQLTLVLVFGMAAGWTRGRTADVLPVSVPVRATGAVLLATALCAMLVTVAPDVVRKWNDGPMTAQELERNKTYIYWPRLWSAGYF